jgi:hypothetical protein
MTARTQLSSNTRSIPCWTTSVFSFTMANDERQITAHTLNSLTVRHWVSCYDRWSVGQSLGIKHPSGACERIFICQTVACLLMWSALFDEGTGLPFTNAAGPRQRSHSRVREHILLSQIRDFLFVASYDSQGYGGGIRPLLHTGILLHHSLTNEFRLFYSSQAART